MKKISIVLLFFLVLLLGSSIGAYTQTIGEQDENISPYALYKEGKYNEALTVSKQLIREDANNISAYVVMGWVYISLQQWKKALDIVNKAEPRAPNDERIMEIKGEAYYRLRENQKALEYFSKYLIADSNGLQKHWVYYFLGNIYRHQNKLDKAEIALSTALAFDGEKEQWWIDLGSVYEQQNRIEDAKKVYRRTLVINSANTIAKQKLQKLQQ